MRKLHLISKILLILACLSCGPALTNLRNPNLQDQSSNVRPAVDKDLEIEKTIQLIQEIDLSGLNFGKTDGGAAASLADYMTTNNLKVALLFFCQEDTAACRMINRDLNAMPIGEGAKHFEVVGVLVEEAKEPGELPIHMKLDDHVSGVLVQSLMETPESDIVPYFALMFKGKSKQGIVSRWPLDKTNHEELKRNVEAFLKEIGSAQ